MLRLLFCVITGVFAMGTVLGNASEAVSEYACKDAVCLRQPRPNPDIYCGTLSNGMRYVLMPRVIPGMERPQPISFAFTMGIGSAVEGPGQEGLAHFMEHMAFNGSKHFEGNSFFLEKAPQMGIARSDFGAFTSFGITHYSLDLSKPTPEHVATLLQFFRDVADGLSLDTRAIEAERPIILEEKRYRESASLRAYVETTAFIRPGHVYNHHTPIGYEAVIREANKADFERFYAQWYRPEHAVLTVIGDFDLESMRTLVEKQFEDFKGVGPLLPQSPVYVAPEPRGVIPKVVINEDRGTVELAVFGAMTPARLEQSSEQLRVDFIDELVFEMFRRRLELASERTRNVFKEPSVAMLRFARDDVHSPVAPTIELQTSQAQLLESVMLLSAELHRSLVEGFAETELRYATRTVMSRYAANKRAYGVLKSEDSVDACVLTVLAGQFMEHPNDSFELRAQFLETLALQQCSERWQQIWQPNERLLIATGVVDLALEPQLAKAYEDGLVLELPPVTADAFEDFAYALPSCELQPRDVTEMPKDARVPRIVRLPNGIDAVLYPDIKRAQYVSVIARLQLSQGPPTDALPTVPGLLGDMVTQLGTGKHAYAQLRDILQAQQIDMELSSDADELVLELQGPKEKIAMMIGAARAVIGDLGWDPAAMPKYEMNVDAFYTALQASELRTFRYRVLCEASPYFEYMRLPQQQEARALTLERVKAYLEGKLRTAPLQIGVGGDVDSAHAEALVRAAFEDMPARQQPQPFVVVPSALTPRAVDQCLTEQYRHPVPKSLVALMWPSLVVPTDWADIARADFVEGI
ncbi:MAG TPA: pitrilysin family protein, partial [Opitutales bacterium]|nr:pitrilysin family protein [Opitutales bacterium]